MILLPALLLIMRLLGSAAAQDEAEAFTDILRLLEGGLRCTPAGGSATDHLSAVRRFNSLKQILSARASLALYALSEDIDPVSGYGASVMYHCRGDLLLSDCALCVTAAFATDLNCSNPGLAQVHLKPS